ncbi:MAG: glycosyltransferase family 9 protein [Flavobacteriales bacterium]|nr:glycosyltransferase family 9 protein [Flavobacteriales bacterium]
MAAYLIIQTAFIGDVILATSVAESIHKTNPEASIDMVVRKGNEGLLANHPFIRRVITWEKRENKLPNLLRTIREIRKTEYDRVINLQRFFSTGWMTWRSRANEKWGFKKNPLAFTFSGTAEHEISQGVHEVDRNHRLIADVAGDQPVPPRLYPTADDERSIQPYLHGPYVCMAPASVWFTKQLPAEKWLELIRNISADLTIYLLGGKSDYDLCEMLVTKATGSKIINVAGKLNFLESAALMKQARMNYVNDSAPLHMATAMNAPVTAFFCSTTPDFGFGPRSSDSTISQANPAPSCKPCGLHGLSSCPQKHFRCALEIETSRVAV